MSITWHPLGLIVVASVAAIVGVNLIALTGRWWAALPAAVLVGVGLWLLGVSVGTVRR